MDRNAKSTIEIIFKHDQFIAVGGRKALTASRMSSTTNWLSAASLLMELTHSSARLSSHDALLELLRLLLGAILPI